jgi:hypothetical protein
VIFQLEDDHSRYAVASHLAWGETATDAIAVFDRAVAAHGVPQRLLSDNGIALNPSRRGYLGQLVEHVSRIGVEAITGKPYEPTTQGKNERFHQTLFRYLDKQPLAESLEELQTQVDAFDRIYNTERPHQGLPGRVTPAMAWEATPKAGAPRPRPNPACLDRPRPNRDRQPRHQPPADLPANTRVRKVSTAGTIHVDKVFLQARRRPRIPAGPRSQRRRQDHHQRPAGRDPRRTHPPRTRHHLPRQRQTPRPTPKEAGVSPKS